MPYIYAAFSAKINVNIKTYKNRFFSAADETDLKEIMTVMQSSVSRIPPPSCLRCMCVSCCYGRDYLLSYIIFVDSSRQNVNYAVVDIMQFIKYDRGHCSLLSDFIS